MVVTGLVPLVRQLVHPASCPRALLDVVLVIHYYEAWLAFLAILIWHMYSTVFSPHVYPMNPSWITGTMPEDMYRHEHPGHLDEARRETKELVQQQVERISPAADGDTKPQA